MPVWTNGGSPSPSFFESSVTSTAMDASGTKPSSLKRTSVSIRQLVQISLYSLSNVSRSAASSDGRPSRSVGRWLVA